MKPPREKKVSSPTAGKGKGAASSKPAPFDVWLARGLHKLYDNVANEPVPDDLLKLIEDDRLSRKS